MRELYKWSYCGQGLLLNGLELFALTFHLVHCRRIRLLDPALPACSFELSGVYGAVIVGIDHLKVDDVRNGLVF